MYSLRTTDQFNHPPPIGTPTYKFIVVLTRDNGEHPQSQGQYAESWIIWPSISTGSQAWKGEEEAERIPRREKVNTCSVAEIPTPPYLKRVREEERKSGESTFPIHQRTRVTRNIEGGPRCFHYGRSRHVQYKHEGYFFCHNCDNVDNEVLKEKSIMIHIPFVSKLSTHHSFFQLRKWRVHTVRQWRLRILMKE